MGEDKDSKKTKRHIGMSTVETHDEFVWLILTANLLKKHIRAVTTTVRATVQPTHMCSQQKRRKHNAAVNLLETITSYDKLPPPNWLFYTPFCCMHFARLAVKGKA